VSPSADRGQQINDERKNITSEDEGNHPFNDGTGVLLRTIATLHTNTECDGKGNLNNHKAQLDYKADHENAVLGPVEESHM
jgi:hypothetical protein